MSIFNFPTNSNSATNANAIDPIAKFHNELQRYPGNNKQWWAAKAQADDDDKNIKEGDFLPKVLDKVFSGNNKAPRGHFLLNAFRKNRSNASGIAGLVIDEIKTRANEVCFLSGRAWWAGPSTVYFSQIINHRSKAGLCYQEADPTSEDISDLIANDGGYVPIPEAQDICKLIPFGNGVVVFAQNGVWFVSGGDSAFSATDVALSKVSSVGTKSSLSIVPVAEMIFWWSETGIHALEQSSGQFGPIPGKFGNDNIAEQTIQSFYNKIPDDSKKEAKGIYDPKNNVVQWIYSDPYKKNRYNKILIFDVTLQAFYPWEIEKPTNGPEIGGVILDKGYVTTELQENVINNSGQTVTTISLDNVKTSVYNTTVENRPTNLTYLTCLGELITFSKFQNFSYVDWETFDSIGTPYSSYIETGYELLEDAMRKKQTIRVFVHLRRTEDDPLGSPSSCTLTTKWDWTSNSNTNKWSRPIEAYRPKSMRIPTTADLGTGYPVVTSNNKVRGSGKAIQFRFECSEAEKNFDLLGWSVAYVGNTEP
jgi:hypothetical protein